MYLRIYWGRTTPDSWHLVEQRYKTLMKVYPAGLLGRFVTQDTNDPQNLFTITWWKDLESLKAWETSDDYKQVFLAALQPYLEGSHTVSLCAVKLAQLNSLLEHIDKQPSGGSFS